MLNFLRGITANFKLQFDGNFVESQAEERSLKLKISSKLALKKSKRF